jgi:hypothetical protein
MMAPFRPEMQAVSTRIDIKSFEGSKYVGCLTGLVEAAASVKRLREIELAFPLRRIEGNTFATFMRIGRVSLGGVDPGNLRLS